MNLFFGIRGIALDLFKSYLTDRYSYTVVAETKSNLQKFLWRSTRILPRPNFIPTVYK